ncbi:MAG: hypothetical protein K2X60_09955 [Xanthobacteraceae bacterium]|nr:hypothetical protein [Xanthobacteraceae bacterium]
MRVFVFVAAGVALAGCSSTSMSSMDFFKSKPVEVTLQLESTPPGATATTSVGPSCKTPCSVQVATADSFTVTYALPKYQSETIPVTVSAQSGSPPVLDPNPAVAELKSATAAKKPAKKKPRAAKPAADDAASPFPPPPAQQ